jgi:hypothetical protein
VNTNTSHQSITAAATATVNISADVADNSDLSVVEIAIGSPGTYHPMTVGADGRYKYEITGDQLDAARDLTFYIRAVDMEGNTIVFNPSRTIDVV